MLRSTVCPALLVSLLACSGGPATPGPAAHQAEIQAWQDEYLQSMTQPEGWLTLVGLLWLEEGDNVFGSGPDVDLRLQHDALPAVAGTFTLSDGEVRFRAHEDADITADSQSVTEIAIDTDQTGDPATVLRSGSLHIIVIDRSGRIGLRIRDLENPLRTEFPGFDFYPTDLSWRFAARFERSDPPEILRVPDVTGAIREMESPGRVVFELRGQEYALVAVDQAVTEQFFLMFADRTSGNATYGAGRYIFVDYPDDDGWVILDFNKAHNPPCAYTRHAVCPLPPASNRLPIRVTAGERDFAGDPL
jgi:uncharacterized protein (DUF1684 family)